MDPTAMMNPMGFGPGMVGGMAPGFGAGAMPHGPRGGFVLEKALPVVRLRGLPFNAGEADVLEFFAGLEAVDALVVRRDGRTTGEAYVVFSNAVQMDFALQKNRAGMGRRYIEVFRSKKAEYYHAVAAAVAEAQTNGGAGAFASARDARADATAALAYGDAAYGDAAAAGGGAGTRDGAPRAAFAGGHHVSMGASAYGGGASYAGTHAQPMPHGAPGVGVGGRGGGAAAAEHTGVLKLRGLPFSATKDDIVGFFSGAGELELTPLVHDSIHIVTSLDGRPSGVAFVEFQSPEEAKIAMARDRQTMGARYVELFASSREEATRAATSGR